MSYEYFLSIESLVDAPDPETAFFLSFRASPHASYLGDEEVLFKEAPGDTNTRFDARLARSKNGLILQINRQCHSIYELFAASLKNASYSIHEEDDDRDVPLAEAFRQR